MISHHIHILIFLAGTSLGAWAFGERFLPAKRFFNHPALAFSLNMAVGLWFLSYGVFLLACVHLISHAILFILFVLVTCAGIALFSYVLYKKQTNIGEILKLPPATLGIILLYGIFIYFCAMLPPNERDELIHHLEVPKQILKHGGFFHEPDNIYFYYPHFGEMLFLYAFGIAGETATKLIHALFGFLTALGLYGFSRRYLTRKVSLLITAIFITAPSVMLGMSLAHVDLIFTLYAFLALILLLDYFETLNFSFALLATWMIAGTLATKYSGISFLLVCACFVLIQSLLSLRPKAILAIPVLFLSMIGILPFFIRNLILTGWPVFPFHLHLFVLNPAINWDPERARLLVKYLTYFGVSPGGDAIWHSIFAPFLVFLKGQFEDPLHYEGVLGSVFLLWIFAVLRGPRTKEVKMLSLFSVLFLYAWAFTTKQACFLIPILPVLGFLAVWGIKDWEKPLGMSALIVFLTGNLTAGMIETFRQKPVNFWLGKETREQYLKRTLPNYGIFKKTNETLGLNDQVYLINTKNYVYYLDAPWRADFIFERFSLDRYLASSHTEDELLSFFSSQKITHILLDAYYVSSPDWGLKEDDRELFYNFLSSHADLVAQDGYYALYKIKIE